MNRILIVEDNIGMRNVLEKTLRMKGYDVFSVGTGENAVRLFTSDIFDLVITDLRLPKMDGLEVLKKIKKLSSTTVVIIMTAYGTIENAIEAMKLGAYDYILKPFSLEEIEIKVEKALSQQRIADENVILKEEIKSRLGRIIGKGQKIQKVYKFINKVADRPTPVLILGESGTGKELVAREIHERSSRRDFPFVAVNCAALAEGVLESELFGHERGAFTGAHAQKKGRFEIADKGTLFLDEIGDLPLNTQVKLLRFLQEKSFERVGGTTTLKVDVRIIAATNKDIKEAIKKKTFREDLFYRLNVITLTLPPLRERREDIPDLLDYFCNRYTKELHKNIAISPEVKDILYSYDWPGNIRELENAIERIIVLSEDKVVNIDDLPIELREGRPILHSKALPDYIGFSERVEYFEKEIIKQALEECGYNQVKTSGRLKMKRGTLQYKMKKYNLYCRKFSTNLSSSA